MSSTWQRFYLCEASRINLDICLDFGGQSFTWQRLSPDSWLNTLRHLVVCLHREQEKLFFSVENPADEEEMRRALTDYMRLDDDLDGFYKEWSGSDGHFRELAKAYPGIRLLRQDPVETLFAFICSQNNAIPRITKMVMHLKRKYGKVVGQFGGEDVHAFPEVEQLGRDGVEGELRAAGFGYRAKYIQQAARHLCEGSFNLLELRGEEYGTCFDRLLEIAGVGPKVADCIGLMSLDQLGAIPVDTHIWQIAHKQYRFPGLPASKSSMSRAVYQEIGGHFRRLFGERAGWAHLILFAAQSRKKKGGK